MAYTGARKRRSLRAVLMAALVGVGLLIPVGVAAAQPSLVPGTPCTSGARACVDLASRQAWLVDNGAVIYGPVPVGPGGPGQETPRGDFTVERKNANHRSREFNGAPMPWSVFFAPGGIAFHEGDVDRPSAGCVRLRPQDAPAFFDFLAIGDPVQVR